MAIRTLLFDLGNVLVRFSHERMCEQMAQVCGVPVPRIRELVVDGPLQHRFERGELTETGFHQALETVLTKSVDFDALRMAVADIFELNEDLVGLLDYWKRDGYRLVLLSNTCVTHYEWVRRRFDLLDRFDDLVLSFRVGAVKPEGAIFRAALDAIGCPPQECFYTDDIPAYVAEGRSVGLQAEVFVDVPSLVRQLEQRQVRCPNSPAPRNL